MDEIKKLEATIEAILFTMGDAVSLNKIAEAIEHDLETTRKIIANMMDRYDEVDRGINIIEIDGSYQMCTKAEQYEYIRKVAQQPKKQTLTDILLETLSIIAYKQPITKLEIEHIRGVRSDHCVNKLIEYNLISEVGRMDAPGRPILFGTSEDFLRNFGMQSLKDLPEIADEAIEKFKEEAEKEVDDDNQLTLRDI
ncbi:MAG: segregation and condensation protein [Clostridiales bacterium]|jgi:segregation and condensation protein B|nr:segregation and condensation protein [Clostridiales bacterium]